MPIYYVNSSFFETIFGGNTIKITGTNFSTALSDNVVYVAVFVNNKLQFFLVLIQQLTVRFDFIKQAKQILKKLQFPLLFIIALAHWLQQQTIRWPSS